jgi:diadenosine tetraphosphatase ApaH/serine/threonine PP2A family protein phosphatase
MLFRPESLTEFAARALHLRSLFDAIAETAGFAREALGSERITWLRTLPITQSTDAVALVHASIESTWVSPGTSATDDELDATYQTLGSRIAVCAHIHQPFVRSIGPRIVANTGSVSLSYDRDPRASYLLVDEGSVTIRRVEYDLAAEVAALKTSGLPHADWAAQTLRQASFVMP